MSGRMHVIELWLTEDEHECVKEAASDAHMGPAEYARLMVLAAAGMGGVLEHLERSVRASSYADRIPGFEITVRKIE